ncbi:C40 family peptidase [Lysinibacillus sp. LZ02]|uniref:C40 family peptidase n=1 Tax=Lysinibacillus sp. LZ02 TaxID=3420668 RepID=UPI003D35F136
MKKHFLTTTLALTIGFSSFTTIPTITEPIEVSAATATTQNNAQAVAVKADQLIATAKSLIGKATYSNTEYKATYPYKFSCATFLMYIFEKNGVDLATYNENYMMQQGTYVPRSQLQKGDLLFFKSKTTGTDPDHVAMYIGNNKVIHMADPKQNIVISDLDSKPYYTESYVTARRVLPTLMSSNPATKGDSIVATAYANLNKVKMGSVNNEAALTFTGGGFVEYIYRKNGVSLGTKTINEQMKLGTAVSKSNLQKGDLVFFNSTKGSKTPSLVAIYAGDHRLIIPNSNGIITRVLLVDYYADHYITARRVANMSTTNPPTQSTTSATQVVSTATSLLGKATFGYSYNESALTFTSAGFTYYVYKKNGINLKYKLASQQATVGTAVAKANLQKGDLLFFSNNNGGQKITQTAIYTGDNQYIMLKTNGTAVKQNILSTWSKNNYVTARRVM